jgi:hypothetical protein
MPPISVASTYLVVTWYMFQYNDSGLQLKELQDSGVLTKIQTQ